MRAIYIDKNIPRALMVKALRGAWPGIVWSAPPPAHVVDVPEPALPGPHWLRVRNRQCGICASDLSLLLVKADPAAAPVALPGNSRFYLGHEVVGDVTEVGAGGKGIRPGQRVVMESRFTAPPCRFCAAGDARLCENASLQRGPSGVGGGWGDGYTAHESEVRAVPDDLSDDQASLVEPMAVALHGVLRRPPRDGEQALVVGAGIIGLLTVQCVKLLAPNARLTVLARHPHQAEAAKRLGADAVLRGGDLYQQVAQQTGGRLYRAMMNRGMVLGGFDVIYDCVGQFGPILNVPRWVVLS